MPACHSGPAGPSGPTGPSGDDHDQDQDQDHDGDDDDDDDDGDDGEDGEDEEEEDSCQLSVCRERLSLSGGWSRNYEQILSLAVDPSNCSIQMVSSERTHFKMSVFFIIISTKAWLPQDPDGDDPLGGLAVFSSEGELETFLRTFKAQDKARNVPVVEINSRLTLP